ncbi:ankyrin repeat domain-containing protein [Rhodovibrio salinarum]|nr:ankyrin repeat domain-containing protein [Rhodovibrio salinarum]
MTSPAFLTSTATHPSARGPAPARRGLILLLITFLIALATPVLGDDSATSFEAQIDRDLIEAVAAGKPGRAAAALKAGASPNARVRPDGRTALMVAADHGHAKLASLLLKAGADVNGRSGDGWSALMQAAYGRHGDVARVLLDASAATDLREDKYGNTALLIATRRGADRTVVALLDHGADPNVQDHADGNTPLINAASAPFGLAASIADTLLQAGAAPDVAAHDGFTPLMAAARTGSLAMVDQLLAAEARVDRQNTSGETALMLAAASGQTAALDRLLEAGADPSIQNAKGNTAICLAIDSRARQSVDQLIATGEDEVLTTRCRDGLPPIARAAKLGDAQLVDRLLAAGVDPDQPGADGSTALMWAANRGAAGAVHRLLDAGASPTAQAKDGWTPQKAAQMLGDTEILRLLEQAN